MTECAMLESFGEEDFHSGEGFAEWSTFNRVHWDEEQDSNSSEDWSSFHGGLNNLSKDLDSPPLSTQDRGHSDHKHKVGVEVTSWSVFSDCFCVEEKVKDTVIQEVLPLSQILHNSTLHTPAQPTLSREALNLCHHLLCEPDSLSLSNPKLNLHSYKQLINTLQLQPADTSTLHSTDLPELDCEETESSPAALIQTKLIAPEWCQNKPGYLYQISRQWLSHNSLRLLPH